MVLAPELGNVPPEGVRIIIMVHMCGGVDTNTQNNIYAPERLLGFDYGAPPGASLGGGVSRRRSVTWGVV